MLPVKVDQDVDGVGMDPLGRLPVPHIAYIDEAIEGTGEARAYPAARVGTVGIADDLKIAAVVEFDQLGNQKRHRMRTEIRGEIAEPYPIAWPRLWARKHRAFGHCHFSGDPKSAVEQFLGRC